jgi:hypothetical protein
MLRMAGVQTHPALRILIGGILIVLGLVRGTAPGVVIGVVLVIWGVAAVLGLAAGHRDGGPRQRRS